MTEDETAVAPGPAQDPFKKEEPKAIDGVARPAATAQATPATQPAAQPAPQPAAQPAPQVNKVG